MGKDIKLYQSAEFKSITVSKEDPSIVYIEGYASVYKNVDGSRYLDRDNESVSVPFLDITNYEKNPIMVYNHDWGDVQGKCVELRKDERGLYIKAEIHKLTGREQVFEAVQKGIIKTFSIGFIATDYNYLEREDAFEISSAELIEISLAPVPANGDALFTVTGTKSLQISKSLVKEQNNLSCDEMNGMCSMTSSTKKGAKMVDIEKEVKPTDDAVTPEVKDEPKKEEPKVAEPNKEDQVTPEVGDEPKKEDAKVAEPKKDEVKVSVEDLALQIVKANELAEQAKQDAEQKHKDEEAKAEQDKIEAEKQRAIDALEYIKQRKAEIEATPAAELDVEELEDFYELVAETVESIDSKIIEVVAAVQNAAE